MLEMFLSGLTKEKIITQNEEEEVLIQQKVLGNFTKDHPRVQED